MVTRVVAGGALFRVVPLSVLRWWLRLARCRVMTLGRLRRLRLLVGPMVPPPTCIILVGMFMVA